MADKIGRVFIEVGADVSQLNARFNEAISKIVDADNKFADTGKRMSKTVENALNPTIRLGNQITALGKAGVDASDQIRYFGDRLERAVQVAERNGKAVDPLVRQLYEAGKASDGAGSGFARLGQAMTDFARNPLAATQAGITSILEKMGPLAVGIGGVAAAIGVAAYEFGKFVVSIANEVEALENLSAQTGISTQRLQAMQQMQREAGLEGMDLSRIIAQLNSQMGKGEGEFVKTVKAMGIALKDSNGEMRDSFDVLSDFGVAIQGIANPTEKVQVAMAALGPRAREFVAFLSRMQGSLKDVADQMQKEGIGFSENAKKNADELDAVLDRLSRKWEIYKTTVKSLALMSPMLSNTFLVMRAVAGEAEELPEGPMGPPLPPGYFQDRINAQEDLDKKQKQSAAEAIAAQKKINDAITASMEWQIKLNDETTVYGKLVDAAAKIWQNQMKQSITDAVNKTGELGEVIDKYSVSLSELNQLKVRGPFAEVTEEGQTFGELMDIQINKTIPDWTGGMTDAAEKVGDVWKRQVSTIVTDWSRGIADILIEGGDFGKKLADIFKETVRSILRMLIEQLFNPLKNLFSKIFGGLTSGASGGTGFLGGLGGILGSAAGAIGTGGLLGAIIPQTPSSKVLGGMVGGIGGISAYGAYMGATTGTGILSGIGASLASIPVWGWAALGATAIGTILYKIFTKSSVEAGAMEAARDLGGIKIAESTVKSFYGSLGLSDKQSYDIRKDLLTSPLFISSVAIPAAQSQGRLDALLKSLEKVTVDTRIAASGFLNFRAAVEQGIQTGNWEAFNKQWNEAFQKSQALTAIMPDFASKLDAVSTAASEAADAATSLSDGMQALLDAILSTRDAADDMYGTFLRTGEILPQLAAEIQKYGGNLEIFQRYASLGGLRENLTAIGNLISGLGEILPDLDPIQKLLSGGGVDWGGLQAMGVDPSKLIGMADLVAFETRWEESVKQFQDTGRLLSGSVLQQALWKFGGAGGATALQNYGQGFNTITPGLLDITKSAMDAAYKTERETALDYLNGVQTTMESEIQVATDAIVTELRNILAAIQAGGAATSAGAVTAQGGMYVDMRGATVFGYDDFQARVNQAVKSEFNRGGMAYAYS